METVITAVHRSSRSLTFIRRAAHQQGISALCSTAHRALDSMFLITTRRLSTGEEATVGFRILGRKGLIREGRYGPVSAARSWSARAVWSVNSFDGHGSGVHEPKAARDGHVSSMCYLVRQP